MIEKNRCESECETKKDTIKMRIYNVIHNEKRL